MSLKCKWVTGSQQCATVRIFCATPSARVDSMSSLHCKAMSSHTTCRRLWSSRSYLSFWKRPTPSIAHDENFGRKQPDLPSLSARTCAAKRQRELEGVSHRFSCTLELFSFSKNNEPRQDCSSTYDFWAVQALAVRTNGNGSQLHTKFFTLGSARSCRFTGRTRLSGRGVASIDTD